MRFTLGDIERDVLDLDLPNMVQMDCSFLSGLLAEALVKHCPPHLNAVFFTNSGTEAVEACLKFARAATGRKQPGVGLGCGKSIQPPASVMSKVRMRCGQWDTPTRPTPSPTP